MTTRRISRFVALLLAATLPAGATGVAEPADLVLVNGRLYTQDAKAPWAQAAAVTDGRYVAIGADADVATHIGDGTQRIDLGGRMLLPGLIDAHVHAAAGAIAELYDCNFPSTSSAAQIEARLRVCVKQAPPGGWIYGGRWDSSFFPHPDMASPRAWLDAIAGDHPVVLQDDSGHNAWANSAALAAAGIDAKSPDPGNGRFLREADGHPNGIALEIAAEVLQVAVPDRTALQWREGALAAQRQAHRFGIVALKEANSRPAEMAAWRDLDRNRELALYVMTCIETLTTLKTRGEAFDYELIERLRRDHRSELVDTNCVKFFLDGVPTPARTATMLAPYLPDEHGRVLNGPLHIPLESLTAMLAELDRRGFTVKMHAAGDGSVREGLDAIAAVRTANGDSSLRHELAHAGFVDATDIPRFKALDAVAEFSPYIWYPSPIMDAVQAATGPRGEHYWPTRSLLAADAPLAAGSDWPSVVPSMDPWSGMEALVTRGNPAGERGDAHLWPEEAITLAQALEIYTIAGARALRRERETGSIEVGKSADFIVVDRDLFSIPATEIGDVQVLETWFKGRSVYTRPTPP